MILRKLLFLFLISLLSATALAYIPQFWMVMSRVAENHGRGLYVIDQDVIFTHLSEPILIREQWLIKDGDTMRVRIYPQKGLHEAVQATFIYTSKKRYYVDSNGVRRTNRLGEDWFEPYFHFRYSDKIKPKMYAQKIIPKEALHKKSGPHIKENQEYKGESYMRLSRVRGVISYGIGTPAPSREDKVPGLWVEQDAFNIRKLRLLSEAEISGDDYKRFSYGLWYPMKRTLQWNNQVVEFKTVRVKRYAESKNLKQRFYPSSLDFGKEPQLALKLPKDPVILEFYKRFR